MDIVSVREFNETSLDDYDAVIVGSPCWRGSIVKSEGIADP